MQPGTAAREQLDPSIRSYIETLEGELEKTRSRHAALESRYEHLKEELRLALYRRFGRSSEQEDIEDEQQQLFSEAEAESKDPDGAEASDETIIVSAHRRPKPGRKPIAENVPRVEIHHDIDETDKQCACGAQLTYIGDEVSERLQVIPEQVYAERHIRHKYACRSCEGSADEGRAAVRVAPSPQALIPGSIATPGLVSFIVTNKFVDHLPLYRQQRRFERIGVNISRTDMSNWIVSVGRRLAPFTDRLLDVILAGPRIQMDETPVQVHRESGRKDTSKSYMWLVLGGPEVSPVCLYHYSPTRGPDAPRKILKRYNGYVQADGYGVYTRLIAEEAGITQVGCWAHARRRFFEAQKGSKKAGAAAEGLKYIDRLYRIERSLRGQELSDEQFAAERRSLAEPVLSRFKTWLAKKSERVLPSSLLGKAVGYTLSEWDHLVNYLDVPELTPDNNAAERAIRPFVVGRKNWLFSGSPAGAQASCIFYSLIETAKANGFNPYGYLHYVLSHLPNVEVSSDWDSLLPQNLEAETVNKAFLAGVR